MKTPGFQIVLLDEHGEEIRRIPDYYEGYADFVLDAYRYDLIRAKVEQGQHVRYFMRTSADRCSTPSTSATR
jgi:hypothetical protein